MGGLSQTEQRKCELVSLPLLPSGYITVAKTTNLLRVVIALLSFKQEGGLFLLDYEVVMAMLFSSQEGRFFY